MFSLSVRARIIYLALFLCLVAAVSVQARGGAERESRRRLAEVEKLIEEKRYNEAVRLLSEVVQEDPDRFDAAEKLMERIRIRRTEIDQSFAELNVAIRENEQEKIVALIDRLGDLNPYPSESEAKLLDMLRAAGIERIYFVNLFRELMARARAQIQAGEYRRAVSTYLEYFQEDFQIVKKNFDEEEYGNILKNSVDAALDNLQEAIQSYDGSYAALESLAEGFGVDPANLPSRVDAAAATLQSLADAVGTVEHSGRAFHTQNEQIREASADDQYDLFLFFSDQLVFGPGNDSPEGIAYALDAIWRRELAGLESGLLQRGQAAYSAAVERFRGNSMDAALANISEAEALFPPLLDLQTLWPLRVEPTRTYPAGEAGRAAFSAALPAFLRTQEYLEALEDYRSLIRANQRVAELVEQEITTAQKIYNDRDELAGLLEETKSLDSSWRDQLALYRQGAGQGLQLTDHASQAEQVIGDIRATVRGIQELDIRLLDRVALIQGAEFEERYRSYRDRFEEGVRLQEGTEVTLEPIRDPESGEIVDTPTRLEQFPSRAVAIYQPLSANLEDLAGGVDAMLADALKNADYVAQSVELQNHIDSLQSLVERTASLSAELGPRLEDARQAALQAERYRREGLLRYGEAQANVNNRRYDSARQNIESARDAFDTSLSFQEDAEVRRIRSEDLIALSERIQRELIEEVIGEVRRLIDEGRRRYAQGDFTGAEQTFRTAQNEWLTAFPTENEEVNFWLGLVRSAVDATTGRAIAETDPLFKEMSQLYNLAYGDFETGRQLIQQGRIREAIEPLDRAESRLLKILFPFPFNAKARVLTLRILQIRDADAFGTRISDLYNEAVRRRTESPQEAYASLKDIEQILPTYPGLQTAIANLEVALGFRIPPPDPAKIARSRDLYLEAQSVWDRQQRFLFKEALDNLDVAISLDPDNRTAVVLKDQLLRAMGGGVTIVLSPEDQRLLQEAQKRYLERRYFEALVIVEQLLRKPANQNNAEILELEKRVRAKTGTKL